MPDTHHPRLLILFPDDWAAYSPTLTRLVERFGARGTVVAYVLDTGRFALDVLPRASYRRVRVNRILAGLLRKLGLWRLARTLLLAWAARTERRASPRVIAIDADGAWAATLLGFRFHFLSLEIDRASSVRRLANRFLSVCIQTADRLEYQFPAGEAATIPVRYLPNAPGLDGKEPRPRSGLGNPARLIYMGNIIPAHGIDQMISLLRRTVDATLVLHGPVSDAYRSRLMAHHADLVAGGSLTFSGGFIQEAEIPEFLSRFDIGICLYDLRGKLAGDYNYLSSPSGKMFNYFAAALPVLASPAPGLRPVSIHQAGIQAASNSAPDLVDALERIRRDYASFSAGAAAAALAYDFDTCFAAYANLICGGEDG